MTTAYHELEKGGFIKQKQKDRYCMRLRTIGGNLSVEQLAGIIELAGKYGQGQVHLTTRQGMEIPGVAFQDYRDISRELKKLDLLPGTCGPRVRAVLACAGPDTCGHALTGVRPLVESLDARFFAREAPNKVKIGVSGCPNSCSKPQENDIGLVGAVEPQFESGRCAGCGLCVEVCPTGALVLAGGRPRIDRERCLNEGDCIAGCPTDAWRAGRVGYHLYLGGKVGRFPAPGRKVASFLTAGEIPEIVEQVLAVYSARARGSERIGDVMARLGSAWDAALKDSEGGGNEWAV
ncbi:MAG: 4Fe-4S binding protein [Peptococcaceae bacterium]|nr:4Fe-4S binding protein [Peptococcaceae bacterium]